MHRNLQRRTVNYVVRFWFAQGTNGCQLVTTKCLAAPKYPATSRTPGSFSSLPYMPLLIALLRNTFACLLDTAGDSHLIPSLCLCGFRASAPNFSNRFIMSQQQIQREHGSSNSIGASLCNQYRTCSTPGKPQEARSMTRPCFHILKNDDNINLGSVFAPRSLSHCVCPRGLLPHRNYALGCFLVVIIGVLPCPSCGQINDYPTTKGHEYPATAWARWKPLFL